MPEIPWYTGAPDAYAKAARERREWDAGGQIAGVVGGLGRLANTERLRRQGVEEQTAGFETLLGKQEGTAQAQEQAQPGTSPWPEEQDAPGSTTDTGESSLHRIARTVLSPFGYMNQTPPGVERPEIKLARLKGQAEARKQSISELGAMQGTMARSPDPGDVIRRLGIPGFGAGTIGVRPPKEAATDELVREIRSGTLSPEKEAQARELLRTLHPGPGAGSPGKPSAAMQEEQAVAMRFRARLHRDPNDAEIALILNLRHGKLDPDLNAEEYQKAVALAGAVGVGEPVDVQDAGTPRVAPPAGLSSPVGPNGKRYRLD